MHNKYWLNWIESQLISLGILLCCASNLFAFLISRNIPSIVCHFLLVCLFPSFVFKGTPNLVRLKPSGSIWLALVARSFSSKHHTLTWVPLTEFWVKLNVKLDDRDEGYADCHLWVRESCPKRGLVQPDLQILDSAFYSAAQYIFFPWSREERGMIWCCTSL